MLASFIRKVFSPCDYWIQAFDDKQNYHLLHRQCISVTSINFMHTFLVSTLLGCFFAWKFLCAIVVVLASFFTWYIFVIFVMKLQKPFFFNRYYFFVILVAYLKASPISLVPLVICVMSLIVLKFIYIQWDKFKLCAMLLSNNLTCVYMTSFWIPCSLFLNYFVCTCFFVDVYL